MVICTDCGFPIGTSSKRWLRGIASGRLGLKELLEAQERVLCFVGYPLADTGSRLRLSDHLKREKDNRTLYFVDYPEDPLRHALLKRIRGIKVGLIQAKIDELPQLLLNLLDQTSDRESGARS